MAKQCAICLSDYTSKTRKKITCQYCSAEACVSCIQTHILSLNAEPACYECKREWNTEFMNDTFGVTFRTKTLRIHRRKMLKEREQSILPSVQVFVSMKRRISEIKRALEEMQPLYTTYSRNYNKLYSLRNINREIIVPLRVKMEKGALSTEEKSSLEVAEENFKKYTLEFEMYRAQVYMPYALKYHRLSSEYTRNLYRYRTGSTEDVKKERREFIMRCPATECRGFLSTAYTCGTCSQKTCSQCREIIIDDGPDHVCKPESVESTKTIKMETQPCPKCAAPIFKIDGCDQMWCTNGDCNTAFSWTTGQIVTGRVHNPHYYEWIRRTGGGAAAREIADIPCGGTPGFPQFSQPFYSKYTLITSKTRYIMFEIHRHVVEIEQTLPSYPQQPPALMNKENNVRYLMNDVNEDEWVKSLEHSYTKFQRRREIGQILHTLVTATADILRNVHMRMMESMYQHDLPLWVESEIIPTLETLRTYTNETFQKFGKANRCATPQLSARWQLLAARTLYKKDATFSPSFKEGQTNTVVEH